MKHVLNMRLLLLAGVSMLAGCHLVGCDSGGFGSGGNEYDPAATTILDVVAEPDTVVQGDSILFTCVITDSLESGFKFQWNPPGLSRLVVTDTNQFRWTASEQPGDYRLVVLVDKPEESVEPVLSGVDFVIVPRN